MAIHPFQLFTRDKHSVAVRIDSLQGRLITASGETSATKLDVSFQNGDSQTFIKELTSRNYERQEVVWIEADSGKIHFSDPGNTLVVNTEPESYIYWGFNPSSVQDLPNVQQHLQVKLEDLVKSLEACPEVSFSHEGFEEFSINGWRISLFFENADVDFTRRRSNGILQKCNGIASVLFLLALKSMMPNTTVQNAFVLSFEDNTEVIFDTDFIPTKLLGFFGISDWESIRPMFEAFKLLEPRFNLAALIGASDTPDDWF